MSEMNLNDYNGWLIDDYSELQDPMLGSLITTQSKDVRHCHKGIKKQNVLDCENFLWSVHKTS